MTNQLNIRTTGVQKILSAMGVCVAILLPYSAFAQNQLEPKTLVAPIELLVQAAGSNPTEFEIAQMVAAEWRKLGLQVNVAAMEFARLSERVFQQWDYDTAVVRYSGRAERVDPYHFIYQILNSKGASNEVGYRSAEYDEVSALSNTLLDVEKRREAVFKAQEISARDQPLGVIVNRNQLQVYNNETFDGYETMLGEGLNSFWNFVHLKPKTNRKTLKMAFAQDNVTFNPLVMALFRDFSVSQLIYDRLVRINAKNLPENWAAESIRQLDPLTFVVKLRPGMTFHDGKPVTSDDIVFTFDLVKNVKVGRLYGLAQPIQSVKALDQLTTEFKLHEPFAPFIANTLGQVFILPKHIWEPIGQAEAPKFSNQKPIGSGPFKLEYWQRDREMKLVKHGGHFSKPHIEEIIRIPYPTVDGIVGALENKEVDFAGWWLEPHEAQRLKTLRYLNVIDDPNHGFIAVNYNNRRPPFDKASFRRALSYAIPKQRVLDLLLEGRGTVAFSTIGPENEFWHNPKIERVSYDLEKAKKILSDAGYRYDSSGKLHAPAN